MEKQTIQHVIRVNISKTDFQRLVEVELRLQGNPDHEVPTQTSITVFGYLDSENGGINFCRKWVGKSSTGNEITKQVTIGVMKKNLEELLIKKAITELSIMKASTSIWKKNESHWNEKNWEKGEPSSIVFSFEIEENSGK